MVGAMTDLGPREAEEGCLVQEDLSECYWTLIPEFYPINYKNITEDDWR